ncbi:MAG: type I glyceraldehyde-3-phosphate dehydrogenase [Gammaproteobacteria bacterium]|nr:type I glyceraldehyde-3-phosphate dehydrogenase [Gammaproteobacteria bacterium]
MSTKATTKAVRVAINGYGRIGRNILRAVYEAGARHNHNIQIVAINDLAALELNAHLTRYDSTHGRFNGTVETEGGYLVVNKDNIRVFGERDPRRLPWGELDIDVVLECTGFFCSRNKAEAHLDAGAKKVLISAPGGNDMDATIVYGVNHHVLKSSDRIVSNASCTTNCLAPIVKPLNDAFGIESGLMNTIHAYTNDQRIIDAHHEDWRRARAAAESMIPTKTGAAAAIGLVIPELDGKLDGFAIRVPVINVSVVDLSFIAKKDVSVESVNKVLQNAANSSELKNILGYSTEPLVSIDYNHTSYSSIVDAMQTKVKGRLVKVLSWYDNEWGFSNRMLDTAIAMMNTHNTD